MSMTKIICNLHWTPCDQLKQHLENNKDLFVPVFGGGKEVMKLCNDKWLDEHVLADDCCKDNISDLNPLLNEMTSLYLIWKNLRLLDGHTANIGLCHYRRFFPKSVLDQIDTCDGILLNPLPLGVFGRPCTLEKQYELCHVKADFQILKQLMIDEGIYEEQTWNRWANSYCLFAPCNMFVLKREVFNMYCRDLFNIALKLPYKIDLTGRDDYQKRACGFLCERFTSYWMFKNCALGNMRFIGATAEEHLDWKPSNAGDARGSYAGVYRGDESLKRIDKWLKSHQE